MKTIFLMFIFLLLSVPGFVYAGRDCEVVSVSLYNDISGDIHDGEGSISTEQCATLIIRNTAGAGRFDGKIIAKFIDGTNITRSFKSKMIANGEVYTKNICWSGKPELDKIDCEL